MLGKSAHGLAVSGLATCVETPRTLQRGASNVWFPGLLEHLDSTVV